MRKYLLLLLGSLFLISPLLAQKGVKFGLRFSPIVSWANIRDNNNAKVDEGNDLSARFGISYGATLSYGFLDNVSLVSGIHIVNKGYSREITSILIPRAGEDTTITNASQKVRMTTVEIPLMIKGRTGEVVPNLYIVGNFGLSLDVSAGYRNEWTGIRPDSYTSDVDSSFNVGSGEINQASEYLRPLSLTFVFGAGVDYVIPNVGMLNAGLTYHQGLSNMRRQRGFGNEATIFGTEEVRMNYMALDLSFFF
jgi:hypothetical protein